MTQANCDVCDVNNTMGTITPLYFGTNTCSPCVNCMESTSSMCNNCNNGCLSTCGSLSSSDKSINLSCHQSCVHSCSVYCEFIGGMDCCDRRLPDVFFTIFERR